jgi:hypothetical protein
MVDAVYLDVFYSPERNLTMRNLMAREARKEFWNKVQSILVNVAMDIAQTYVSGGTIKFTTIARNVALELANSQEIKLFFSARDLATTVRSFPRVWGDFKRSAALSTEINKLFPNGPPASSTAFMSTSFKQIVLDCVTKVHGVAANIGKLNISTAKPTLKFSEKLYLVQLLSLTPREVQYLNWRTHNIPGKTRLGIPAGLKLRYRTVTIGRTHTPVDLWGFKGVLLDW